MGGWQYIALDKGVHAYPGNIGDDVEAQTYFALVRIGKITKEGVYGLNSIAWLGGPGDVGSGQWGFLGVANPPFGKIVINHLTCKINSVPPVNMGAVSSAVFNGGGSKSKPVHFDVDMTCPAGINKLAYEISPAGGSSAADGDHGVLSLSNQGGAAGVGVQLMDSQNNPLPLLQQQVITQYDPNKDGQDINLGFNAAYIQTGQKVTPGEADAQAVLTLSYQ